VCARLRTSRFLRHLDLFKAGLEQVACQVHLADPLWQSFGDGPARLPCRDGQPAPAGQDPVALSQGRQWRVAELDGVDAHDRVSAMVADTEGGEVAHAESCPAARASVCGYRDRHGGEVQADQAGAGPAGNLAAVTAAPAGQVDEDLPGRYPQRGCHLGYAGPGEQAVGDDLWRQAERPLEDQGACRGIRDVRVPRVEAWTIHHEGQHLSHGRAPGAARAA
jgi:hypothetical protein